MGLLSNERGNLVTWDEKAEILNDLFASVFISKGSNHIFKISLATEKILQFSKYILSLITMIGVLMIHDNTELLLEKPSY